MPPLSSDVNGVADLVTAPALKSGWAKLLNAAGIFIFEQLTAMTPEQIRVILDDADISE